MKTLPEDLPREWKGALMWGKGHYMNLHRKDVDCSECGCVPLELSPEGSRDYIARLEATLMEYTNMYEQVQPAGGWQGVYEDGVALLSERAET